jgi:hypothetical protein
MVLTQIVLNWRNMILKFYVFTMCLIFNTQKIFHTKFVLLFMICLHGSFVISAKWKATFTFCVATVLFCILWKHDFNKDTCFKELLPCQISWCWQDSSFTVTGFCWLTHCCGFCPVRSFAAWKMEAAGSWIKLHGITFRVRLTAVRPQISCRDMASMEDFPYKISE